MKFISSEIRMTDALAVFVRWGIMFSLEKLPLSAMNPLRTNVLPKKTQECGCWILEQVIERYKDRVEQNQDKM